MPDLFMPPNGQVTPEVLGLSLAQAQSRLLSPSGVLIREVDFLGPGLGEGNEYSAYCQGSGSGAARIFLGRFSDRVPDSLGDGCLPHPRGTPVTTFGTSNRPSKLWAHFWINAMMERGPWGHYAYQG